ncbi:MAG TPA: hypothetical protein VLN45_11395 [Ignavibacteriaceae bacterium]|nr:hypothetical protein [Ignavibacteriaceae bacterium]
MKKMIVMFAAVFALFVGCSENLQVNEPEVKTASGPNWITLPQKSGSSVETEYSVSGVIDGTQGGQLSITEIYFAGPFGNVKVSAKLKFAKNSFAGTETITMVVDNVNGTVTYSPHMNFSIPALLDLEFQGIDLTGINPDSIDFVYHNPDGYFDTIDYQSLTVKVADGKLTLTDGKIPHFSRYGFSR